MLQQLIESRRARRFAGGALLASVAVHAASVGAATRRGARDAPATEEFLFIRYLLPPNRMAQPLGERVQVQLVTADPATRTVLFRRA